MLVSDAIKAAMRKNGLIASGEAPTTNEYADGLSALQSMLRAWAAEKINVFASVNESFTLTASTASYSWGSGGTITTTRPHEIIGAYVLDSSNYSHPIDIISAGQYRIISAKTLESRPNKLWYDPSYPLSYVYLWPTPDSAETVYVDSFKPFTEASSFSAITDTLSFPPEYEEPIVYNLAIRICSEFGKEAAPTVAAIAVNSFNRIKTLNSSRQVESVRISIPASRVQGRYNINSDI